MSDPDIPETLLTLRDKLRHDQCENYNQYKSFVIALDRAATRLDKAKDQPVGDATERLYAGLDKAGVEWVSPDEIRADPVRDACNEVETLKTELAAAKAECEEQYKITLIKDECGAQYLAERDDALAKLAQAEKERDEAINRGGHNLDLRDVDSLMWQAKIARIERSSLRADNAKLQARLDGALMQNFVLSKDLKMAKENGAICHCGEYISEHPTTSGHAPVESPYQCPYAQERDALRSQIKERVGHLAQKLAIVLGLNNQERQWVRECGIDCPDEKP